ncbi:hypothetical protein FKP32DRAFT_1612786 [Trametes sanguinea]|nr:hypothetical protein FKP32DRAFT_1612786 [Trametes sanguinea]
MSQAESLQHLWPVLRDADMSVQFVPLVLYEHALTLNQEVQQIWKRDASAATILFVMTRYLLLVDRVFAIISLYPIRDLGAIRLSRDWFCSCSILLWIHAITSSALITVMSAIAAIRVYALWNRDLRLLAIVMLTGLFPAFANLFFRGASAAYVVPTRFYSCQSAPVAMTARSYTALAIATRVISIVSDGLVVVLTWVKTFRVYALARRARFRADYSLLLLRDGAVYFLCVLNFVAIVYIIPEFKDVRADKSSTQGTNVLNDLIVTLTSILMVRFLLNLRDRRASLEEKAYPWEDSEGTRLTTRTQPLSSIRFASGVLETMGGTVSMASDEDDQADGQDDEMNAEEEERVDDAPRVSGEVVQDAVTWA